MEEDVVVERENVWKSDPSELDRYILSEVGAGRIPSDYEMAKRSGEWDEKNLEKLKRFEDIRKRIKNNEVTQEDINYLNSQLQGEKVQNPHEANQSQEQKDFVSELKSHNCSESEKMENTIRRMENEKSIDSRNITREEKDINYTIKER